MKILWLVNTIFPYPAKQIGIENTCFAGWLNSMYEEIIKNGKLDIAIVATYDGKKLQKFRDNSKKTIYYLVPDKHMNKYNPHLNSFFQTILEEFKPDIIHIHGTEYPKGLSLINSNTNINIPIVTSIQGLSRSVAKVYYSNMTPLEIIKNITFRDLVKMNTIFDCKKDFAKRSFYEEEIIKKSNYIIGRTLWDKTNVLTINPQVKYFSLNETLRDSFYTSPKWDLNNIEKYSLFCSQSSYPLKGLHILLKALAILKKDYPELKLYVSGLNVIDDSTFIKRLKRVGYGKYLKKLISKYDLKNNVIFTGMLNEQEVSERLLKTHVFVSPSFIENESNSLSEALILGTPSVASYVGGTTERIIQGFNGFQYCVLEDEMLAYYIKKFFENDELAQEISKNSIKRQEEIVSKSKNYQKLINIYEKIKKEEK